ncbi:hypothetical protein TMatcc_008257 [Talaromyces marneffei ATCC 18224]
MATKPTTTTKAREEFLAPLNDRAGSKHYRVHNSSSSDMANPRNWSTTKKRLLFAALISSSLLADGYVNLLKYEWMSIDDCLEQ